MRLEELTLDLLERALEIYFQKAYPDRSKKKPPLDLPPDAPPEKILQLFLDETPKEGGESLRRYVMRLGNRNYPYMKLVFQEHLFPGEFCFVVDTHDDIEVPVNAPDYEAWVALKEENRRLKREIEQAWEEEGIPTQTMLQELAALNPEGPQVSQEAYVLVADDEEDAAEAVVTLLRAKGYRSRAVFDGRAALEAARAERPDLLVLDNEMPNLSGMEVLDALRREEETSRLPVLLVTGGPISLSEMARASGFLRKPFSEEDFLEVVRHLLEEKGGGGGLAQGEGGS